MKIKRGDLQQLIRKNLYHENIQQINESFVKASSLGPGFQFEFCDLTEIEFTEGYKKVKEYIAKGNESEIASELRKLEILMEDPAELQTAAAAFDPPKNVDAYRNEVLIAMENLKKEQRDQGTSMIDTFADGLFKGITTPGFAENMGTLLNIGAYASMGPAATLYCKTLKNVVSVVNKALGVYVQKPDEQSGEEKLDRSTFGAFFQKLQSAVGLTLSTADTRVLNAYFRYKEFNEAQKALFIVTRLKQLLEFNPATDELLLAQGVTVSDAASMDKGVENFDNRLTAASAEIDSVVSKLLTELKKSLNKKGKIRRDILRTFKQICNSGWRAAGEPDNVVKNTKFDFNKHSINEFMVDTFAEDIRRKTDKTDPGTVQKENDYKSLVNYTSNVLNSLD